VKTGTVSPLTTPLKKRSKTFRWRSFGEPQPPGTADEILQARQ
jgi:hypothetical protein